MTGAMEKRTQAFSKPLCDKISWKTRERYSEDVNFYRCKLSFLLRNMVFLYIRGLILLFRIGTSIIESFGLIITWYDIGQRILKIFYCACNICSQKNMCLSSIIRPLGNLFSITINTNLLSVLEFFTGERNFKSWTPKMTFPCEDLRLCNYQNCRCWTN
jgi:hypothetical protein